jgi:hypothetical protein
LKIIDEVNDYQVIIPASCSKNFWNNQRFGVLEEACLHCLPVDGRVSDSSCFQKSDSKCSFYEGHSWCMFLFSWFLTDEV